MLPSSVKGPPGVLGEFLGGCCSRAAERSDSGAASERMRPVGRPTATGARRWSDAERALPVDNAIVEFGLNYQSVSQRQFDIDYRSIGLYCTILEGSSYVGAMLSNV